MDRDDIIELFAEFGPIVVRRMFSGFGIVADDVNFAMSLRDGIIFRVDEQTVGRFEAEGSRPFEYTARGKTVVVKSYWLLPERLYDDPEELAQWAREAVSAARRAAAKKKSRKQKPAKVPASATLRASKPKAAGKKTARKITKHTAKKTAVAKKSAARGKSHAT